ncbi:hypothetical protein [Streptomyces sp. NPDC001750]|uniref:hypothetical protein n=1 Tax=unclassified Streptomyces TaxID=2593676 RepID=UPI0036C4FA7F
MTTGRRPTFAAWLTEEMRRRGYDLTERGAQSRFARDAGINPAILSRTLLGKATPDIQTCRALARVLGYTVPHVLVAAGLITHDEVDTLPEPREYSPRDHVAALVGNDAAAQEAVIALLRALKKWAP